MNNRIVLAIGDVGQERIAGTVVEWPRFDRQQDRLAVGVRLPNPCSWNACVRIVAPGDEIVIDSRDAGKSSGGIIGAERDACASWVKQP